MKSIKYLLGTAIAMVGLTVLGLAHDSYDDGYYRSPRQEHRDYHAQKEYEHELYHQYPHSRLGHWLYHLRQRQEHREMHRYLRDRRYYDGNNYDYYDGYRRSDPYYRY